jgi:extradiol dioxygenase family protein
MRFFCKNTSLGKSMDFHGFQIKMHRENQFSTGFPEIAIFRDLRFFVDFLSSVFCKNTSLGKSMDFHELQIKMHRENQFSTGFPEIELFRDLRFFRHFHGCHFTVKTYADLL